MTVIQALREWIRKVGKPQLKSLSITSNKLKYLVNDPAFVDLAIEVTLPKDSPLPIAVNGYIGTDFKSGTIQHQAASCYFNICTSLAYIMPRSPKPITKWAATNKLQVFPRAGEDLNAYYDRKALRFFYEKDPKSQNVIYACESSDVVSHELGHAILDILRPDLFNVNSTEISAFHESFGDINAILTTMQFDEVLNRAVSETSGNLMQSNIISRLAEEMAKYVYEITGGKGGESPFYLRNAVNNFKYVEPEKLPMNSKDDKLSREFHNFSRVFTGAWYEMMIRIYEKHQKEGMNNLEALKKARDVSCVYLLNAVLNTPLTVRFYNALAKQLLVVDGTFGRPYRGIINAVFLSRNILKNSVKILGEYENWYDMRMKIKEPHQVIQHEEGYSVRIMNTKQIKMINHLGLSAQTFNPLFNVEVQIPSEKGYEFDADGNLVDVYESTEKEIVDSTYACLNYLHKNDLVGPGNHQPFEIVGNKLIRKFIMCKCNQNNACDPNAPEFGKAWKGGNNAGCCGKGVTKLNCDCNPPAPTPAPKLGCYTSIKVGGLTRAKFGSNISRKVC